MSIMCGVNSILSENVIGFHIFCILYVTNNFWLQIEAVQKLL